MFARRADIFVRTTNTHELRTCACACVGSFGRPRACPRVLVMLWFNAADITPLRCARASFFCIKPSVFARRFVVYVFITRSVSLAPPRVRFCLGFFGVVDVSGALRAHFVYLVGVGVKFIFEYNLEKSMRTRTTRPYERNFYCAVWCGFILYITGRAGLVCVLVSTPICFFLVCRTIRG